MTRPKETEGDRMSETYKVARASKVINWALTRPKGDWRTDPLPREHGTVCIQLDNGYYGVNWPGVLPCDVELMDGASIVCWLEVAD